MTCWCLWWCFYFEILQHSTNPTNGGTAIFAGNLNGVEYFIWAIMEAYYVMKNMGIGGALVTDDCKEAHRKWTDGIELHSKKFN